MKFIVNILFPFLIPMIILSEEDSVSKISFKISLIYSDDQTNITNLTNEPFCCPIKMLGDGNSYFAGANYNFYNVFGFKHFDISTGININYYSSLIYFDEEEPINVNGEPFIGRIRHSINFKSYSLNPELSIKYNFSHFFIKYNIGLDYFIKNDFIQKEEIIFPLDRGVFQDTQTRTRNAVESNIENLTLPITNSLIFGFKFNFNSKILISPGLVLGYRTTISNDFDWVYRSYGLNIDFQILN